MRRHIICTLLLALLLFFPAFGEDTVVLTGITGKVEVKPFNGEWRAAAENMTVSLGATISTGFNSTAVVTVGDSQVTVKPLSRMTLDKYLQQEGVQTTRLFLQVGALRAEVDSSKNIKQDFKVMSPFSTASVRGTIFESTPFGVEVIEGRVAFALGAPQREMQVLEILQKVKEAVERKKAAAAESTEDETPASSEEGSPAEDGEDSAEGEDETDEEGDAPGEDGDDAAEDGDDDPVGDAEAPEPEELKLEDFLESAGDLAELAGAIGASLDELSTMSDDQFDSFLDDVADDFGGFEDLDTGFDILPADIPAVEVEVGAGQKLEVDESSLAETAAKGAGSGGLSTDKDEKTLKEDTGVNANTGDTIGGSDDGGDEPTTTVTRSTGKIIIKWTWED